MLNDEKGLIGCILYEPEYCMNLVYNRIRPEMFTNDFCQDVYICLLKMFNDGEDITLVEVARLLEDERRDKEEVVPFLGSCVENISTANEVRAYAKTIETEFKTKQIQILLNNTRLEPNNIDNIIEDLQAEFEKLKENKGKDIQTLAEITEENQDRHFNESVDTELIQTGFEKFDECIGGFEGGEMIVIGARPSAGKSAFITQIITNIAERGHSVGYFNLEMGAKQIYQRVVARYSGIELSRIQHGKYFLNDEEMDFKKANERMKKLSNVTVISGSCKLTEIKAECRHRKFDLIVIDYLQLIIPTRHFDNKASEVGRNGP